MPGYVLTNFLVYAIVNAFTPGPGNILALNTVTNYGWKKGKPLFLGIFTGYYVVQIICAVFVYEVGTFLPNALRVMKYVGAAYILWLAMPFSRDLMMFLFMIVTSYSILPWKSVCCFVLTGI